MDTNIVSAQITISAIIVWILQRLKDAGWFPWLTEHTDTLNRIVGAVLALAAALGLQYQYSSDTGTLLVSGLRLESMLVAAADWLRSFVFQQLIYHGVMKRVR